MAERLRAEILDGARLPGMRFANELDLAEEHGVSRATIREALRLLGAENLIRTTKGAGGGSYVTLPSASDVSESLRSGLGRLASAEHVTLDELVEARALLEVPAARLAARRRGTTTSPGCESRFPAIRCASERTSSSSTTATSTPS